MITNTFIEDAYIDFPWIDVQVYIDLCSGDSWRVAITKNLEEGTVEYGDFLYAIDPRDSFDVVGWGPPQEVEDFVAFNMAEILVKIGRAQAEYELSHN